MVRNIVLLGHQDSGKTTFTEAALYVTNNSDRLGHIEEENTVSDFELEEKRRRMSMNLSVIPLHVNGDKINLLDTPGYSEFIGESVSGIHASDAAILFVSGRSGLKVGTIEAFQLAIDEGIPVSFYINKLDKEESDFRKVLRQLQERFGYQVVPIQFPYIVDNELQGIVDLLKMKLQIYDFKKNKSNYVDIPIELVDQALDFRQALVEIIAENNEDLLNAYFEEGALNFEQVENGFKDAFLRGEIHPVMCGSSQHVKGTHLTIQQILTYFPTIHERFKAYENCINSEEIQSTNGSFVAQVFKTIADPFVGKLSYFRIIRGELTSKTMLFNSNQSIIERNGGFYAIRGKELGRVDKLTVGDIGAFGKLQETKTGNSLCAEETNCIVKQISFPIPTHNMVIHPVNKGDEDRLSNGLTRIQEEDCTIHVFRDEEFNDLHILAMGDTHLDMIKMKLKEKFNIDVTYTIPKIPYRETIKGKADVQGKYKKQSGGHGQYGDVKILFEHRLDDEEGLDFIDKVVGGTVPRQYIPAVEKGLQEAITHGVLGGFPVIQLKATLHDGSYHTVDSSEFAFKAAASQAFKKGLEEARPVLLEPIVKLIISISDEWIGDIMGDITKRRGRVIGMEEKEGLQLILAEVPMAEILTYTTDLKSLTAGEGHFTQEFLRYEEVPNELVQGILEKCKEEEVQ